LLPCKIRSAIIQNVDLVSTRNRSKSPIAKAHQVWKPEAIGLFNGYATQDNPRGRPLAHGRGRGEWATEPNNTEIRSTQHHNSRERAAAATRRRAPHQRQKRRKAASAADAKRGGSSQATDKQGQAATTTGRVCVTRGAAKPLGAPAAAVRRQAGEGGRKAAKSQHEAHGSKPQPEASRASKPTPPPKARGEGASARARGEQGEARRRDSGEGAKQREPRPRERSDRQETKSLYLIKGTLFCQGINLERQFKKNGYTVECATVRSVC